MPLCELPIDLVLLANFCLADPTAQALIHSTTNSFFAPVKGPGGAWRIGVREEEGQCWGALPHEWRSLTSRDNLRLHLLGFTSSLSTDKEITGSLTHRISSLDADGIEDVLKTWSPEGGAMLVALHACGDLTVDSLKAFTRNSDGDSSDFLKRKMVAVGCCYNLMTPELFPLSEHLATLPTPPLVLTRDHLLLTAQTPQTWHLSPASTSSLASSITKLAHRSRLGAELEAHGLAEQPKLGRIGVSINYLDYRRKALQKASLLEQDLPTLRFGISDEEEDGEREWEDGLFQLEAYWTLRARIGPPLESFLRAQCEYDSPNHFTASFCGDFEEATTKTLYTDRSPILFEFIVQHLSDYDVLPLPSLPTMSPEAALQNLLHDAQYFGLSKLEAEIAPLIEHSRGPAALESVGYARRISLATLTSGASSLERNTAMWASEVSGVTGKGRLVPLAGDRLPPLVRVTEVNLVIDWEDSFQTGITLGIASPALDAAIVVPAKKDTPPLTIQQKSYCFFYAEDLDSPYMGAERPIEPERPDPTITIDGHQVTMDRFRKSLALWGPNLPPPPPDLSPFDNALYRHLNSTRVTRGMVPRRGEVSFKG
ncbi:hypothetical protein RQP46_005744 [Phenoliferia psychrophenolica]